MKFRGFRSIGEFESECARLGWKTERIPFRKEGNEKAEYFALVVTPPEVTDSSISSWHLFPNDESEELLEGIISGGYYYDVVEVVDENGLDLNWLGKLANNGFYPVGEVPAWPDNRSSWLAGLRFEARITQTEVARLVGIDEREYREIDYYGTTKNEDTAKKIADVLGFEWTRFFEEEKEVAEK